MYDVFNRKTVANYIYQDGICKGYSIHLPKGVALWEKILNSLLECFGEEFDGIKIINTVPPMCNSKLLTNFYAEHFYRIENRIPCVNDRKSNKEYITTDALPYLVSKLNEADNLFSTYTVVRPRSFAVKPFLREEFIRYFQFIISFDENDMANGIEKIMKATNTFFERTRLSVTLVDRHSDSYYLKKSCFHSIWMNGNVESILQCGIIRKRFETMSGKDRIVVDIGGAQRLLASFIYANSDMYGLFLPYYMRDYDIIIRYNNKTEVINSFIKNVTDANYRVKLCPGDLSLKKIKKIAIEESAVAIVTQRMVNGNDFLTIYNRDMSKSDIVTDWDVTEWILKKYPILERLSYEKQYCVIRSRIIGDILYYKNGNKGYTIVREGLFN